MCKTERDDIVFTLLCVHHFFGRACVATALDKTHPTKQNTFIEAKIKATHWSTNGDITDAHISATIQQILTKFSAVVSYVKQRQIGKFQLICT